MTYTKPEHAAYMRGWRKRKKEADYTEALEYGYTTAVEMLVKPEMIEHVAQRLLQGRDGEFRNAAYREAAIALHAAWEILTEAQKRGQ